MMTPLRVACRLALVVAALLCALPAQGKKDDEIQKLDKVDPFTKGDDEAMKALGVAGYAPFSWADGITTREVDKVLGEGRILWMETEHFRIGLNFATSPWPAESPERKQCQAECKLLNKRWRKFPKKPKKLGPWVRLHLYAYRCEKAYAEFQELVGITDEDKPHLGSGDKQLLLLFQKKSDMGRYMKRFLDIEADDSMRAQHRQSNQMILVTSAEGMEGFDAAALHSNVVRAIWLNLINGYNSFRYPVPPWLAEGIAHYFSRRVKTKFVNIAPKDGDSVAKDDQDKWAKKLSKRAKHEGACVTFETMAGWQDQQYQLGFYDHLQAWSRVDYLMHIDKQKVGELLRKAKGISPNGDYTGQGKQCLGVTKSALYALFELDGPTFDERWRAWVLKAYPKRRG